MYKDIQIELKKNIKKWKENEKLCVCIYADTHCTATFISVTDIFLSVSE